MTDARRDPMRNLGPVSRQWLADVGVTDPADIARIGPVAISVMLKRMGRTVTWNLLWSLQWCLMAIDWRSLPEPITEALRQQVAAALHD